jgi:hypothetical protein
LKRESPFKNIPEEDVPGLVKALEKLSPGERDAVREKMMANAKRAGEGLWQMPGMQLPPQPAPVYACWEDYLVRTIGTDRMARCAVSAKKANQKRLLSEIPKVRVTAQQVWAVLESSQGRCAYCGSLAVERRPSNLETGAPIAWAQIGRRIGSLGHVKSRIAGGDNDPDNLVWSCLWCNTWPRERRPGAVDHGGYYPER